jgi:hypothetical protein
MIDIGVTGERHQTLQAQAYSKHLLPFKSRMFSALTVSLLLALFVVIKRRCKNRVQDNGVFSFWKIYDYTLQLLCRFQFGPSPSNLINIEIVQSLFLINWMLIFP